MQHSTASSQERTKATEIHQVRREQSNTLNGAQQMDNGGKVGNVLLALHEDPLPPPWWTETDGCSPQEDHHSFHLPEQRQRNIEWPTAPASCVRRLAYSVILSWNKRCWDMSCVSAALQQDFYNSIITTCFAASACVDVFACPSPNVRLELQSLGYPAQQTGGDIRFVPEFCASRWGFAVEDGGKMRNKGSACEPRRSDFVSALSLSVIGLQRQGMGDR